MDPKEICVLVSYDSNYASMAEITVQNNIKRYCELHGYNLVIDEQKEIDNDRSPQWQKIKTSINLLKNNSFKWLLFLDTDCLIMNPNIKLDSLLDDNYSFIVPQQSVKAEDNPITNIEGIYNVITSQFLVKNDEFGLSILEEIWSAKGWPDEMSLDTFDYENRQVRIIINNSQFKDKIKIIDEKLLNRFWYVNNPFVVMHFNNINNNVWQPGDFIVHVVGYKTEDRIQLLSDLNYFSGLQK